VRVSAFALASLVLTSTLVAQSSPTRATRVDGTVVLLYPDGTWKPDTVQRGAASHAVANYSTPGAASASLPILNGATLSYNPSKWTPVASGKPGRLQLNHASGDGYAMVIAERLEIPIHSFKNIVLQNARGAAPDAEVKVDEERQVNGTPVTCMEITGTTQGIPFHYFGYYYSGKGGSIQVITYTGESLFEQYRTDFQELLNGFVAPGG